MVKKLIAALISVFLLLQYGVVWATEVSGTTWIGEYEYQVSLGHTVGGDPILLDMKLTIGKEGQCEFVQQGYQTDDDVICKISVAPNGINILFEKFSNGEIAYPSGVVIYRPGEVLFSLSKSKNHLITKWGGIKPDGLRRVGKYFE
jgi:hypothetical protein